MEINKDYKLKIHLPWPPSVNHYWIQRGARRLLSPKARAYKQRVREMIPVDVETIEGKVTMHIMVYQPDHRKRDLDNLLKAIFDSLMFAKVFEDDSQVVAFGIEFMPDLKKGGSVVVTINY